MGGKYQQLFSQRLWLSFTYSLSSPSVRSFGRRAGTWEGLGREGKALGLLEDWVENRQLANWRIWIFNFMPAFLFWAWSCKRGEHLRPRSRPLAFREQPRTTPPPLHPNPLLLHLHLCTHLHLRGTAGNARRQCRKDLTAFKVSKPFLKFLRK